MNEIRISVEDPRSAVAAALIAELSQELAKLYPDSHGGDGSGSFRPEDVLLSRAAFVVAWRGEEGIACGAIRPMPDESQAEVKRMFVRPNERGKGLSRLILGYLEDLARDFGYSSLILETGQHQKAAIALYESSGFQRIDCYEDYIHEPLSLCYQKTL